MAPAIEQGPTGACPRNKSLRLLTDGGLFPDGDGTTPGYGCLKKTTTAEFSAPSKATG